MKVFLPEDADPATAEQLREHMPRIQEGLGVVMALLENEYECGAVTGDMRRWAAIRPLLHADGQWRLNAGWVDEGFKPTRSFDYPSFDAAERALEEWELRRLTGDPVGYIPGTKVAP